MFSNFGFIGVKRQAAVNLRISTKNTCFQALGIEALRIKLDHATGFVQDGYARHDLHIVVLQSQAALYRRFLQSANWNMELHFEFGDSRSLAFFKRAVQEIVEGRPRYKGLHISQWAARMGFDSDIECLHVGHARFDFVPSQLRRSS